MRDIAATGADYGDGVDGAYGGGVDRRPLSGGKYAVKHRIDVMAASKFQRRSSANAKSSFALSVGLASEIHPDADRRREVDAIEIAARQPAGDLRPQEAAVSLDALGRTIRDHRGEGVERAAAA